MRALAAPAAVAAHLTVLLGLAVGLTVGLAVGPVGPASGAPPAITTCAGVEATIVGTAADDHITATSGDDVIVARGGDDTVLGRGGEDLVCGGEGADVLRGGPGADELHGQREARVSDRGGTYFRPDVLDGGAGSDLLDVGGDPRWVEWGSHGTFSFARARSAVTVDLAAGTATGQGADVLVAPRNPDCETGCFGATVQGSAYDDVLLGSPTSDELVGGLGDDVLDGRGDYDELVADPYDRDATGDDTLTGGDGADYLHSYAGRDVIDGQDGDDTVWQSRGGASRISGGEGDDLVAAWFPRRPGFALDGGAGDDEVHLRGPVDVAAGGRPTAALVTMADGLVVANEVEWGRILGAERLVLDAELRWEYLGTDGPDSLRSAGTSLHATTYGGDDVVWGTNGPDRIDAGEGHDRVEAWGGRDHCLNAEVVRSCEVRD